MGAAESTLSWRQARDFLVDKFASFDSEMAELAVKAFDQNWIDGATQVCLDISSRFRFETALFAARAESELGAEQFR